MAQENRFVATFQTGRHYQVHKSYIWVAPATAMAAVVAVGLLNSIQGLVQLGMAVRSGDLAVNPLLVAGVALAGFAVLFGLLVGLYALAWRNMSYVFDEREFSYYSGIITKRRVHVPYARVQSVNHRASLVQRIVGVCTVSIDSAGGSSNRAVRVPYLPLETAERLRAELFARKAAAAAGAAVTYLPVETGGESGTNSAPVPPNAWTCPQCGASNAAGFCSACGTPRPAAPERPNVLDEVAGPMGDWRGLYGGSLLADDEPATCEYGLQNHELLLTSLSHDAPIVTAAIVGISFLVMLGFLLLIQDEVSRFLAVAAVPVIVVSAAVGWVIGLAAIALSYGNFRVRRRGSRIEVERGILARDLSGIDVDRVQSIEVRQSFVRRLMGYCELSLGRIDAAGEQSKGNNNSRMGTKGLVIHPFVKMDRVDDILDALLPELADRPRRSQAKPLPHVALRRALLRRCVWYNWALWATLAITVCWGVLMHAVASGAIGFDSIAEQERYLAFMCGSLAVVVVLCVALTAVFGVGAVLWARGSGYTWNARYVLLCNDGLSTAQSTVPRQKIQAAATRDNPFQRRLNLTSLNVVTAIGATATTVRLIDVPAEDGAAYLEWLQPNATPSSVLLSHF